MKELIRNENRDTQLGTHGEIRPHQLTNNFCRLFCCRGGSCTSGFSWERPTWRCSWTSGEPTSMGTSTYVNKWLEVFLPPGEHRRISPWHNNALGFFSWGRSLKIHTHNKRVIYIHAFERAVDPTDLRVKTLKTQ